MRILQFYLLRQTLATLGMSVAVFTFIMLLANVLKSVLGLLIGQHVGLMVVGHSILLLIPYVLAYSLPIGMLTAMLLVMGQFSADNELMAARANGISLAALTSPILGLSLLFCGLCAYINLELAPKCRAEFKALIFQMASQGFFSMIPEGTYIQSIPGVIFYAGTVNPGTSDNEMLLEDVMYYETSDGRKIQDIRAPEARLTLDREANNMTLRFFNATYMMPDSSMNPAASAVAPDKATRFFVATIAEISVDLPLPEVQAFKGPKIRELTFRQLRAKERELLTANLEPADLMPIRVHLQSQLAFSFASFGFTLVGIPLGIRTHRRETSAGMAIAIVLMLVYNGFFILGQGWQTEPQLYPHLIVWLPNFLFQSLGLVLFWKANRGI